MRRSSPLFLLLAAVLAGRAGAAAAPDRSARLAAALRDTLEGMVPVPSPGAPRSEPPGAVAIEFADDAKPLTVLAEAVRLEQEGKWAAAGELYQRLMDETPGQLCRRGPRLYVPVRAFAEERIARFPPQGLADYRVRVDRAAEQLYLAALTRGDPRAMRALADRYLLSSRGDDALAHLASRWLARGQYARAMRAWRRLLRLCRDTDAHLPTLAVKVAVCLQRQGRVGAARSLLERAAALTEPGTTVRFAGRQVPLADVVARVAGVPPARGARPEDGGGATPVRPGRLLWSGELFRRGAVEAALRRRVPLYLDAGDRVPRPMVRMAPVVAGGCVIYPSWAGILSRRLTTGKLRWEWGWPRDTAGGAVTGPYETTWHRAGQWACSAAGRRVLCSLPLQEYVRRQEFRTYGHLVALEADTGASAWTRRASRRLGPPREEGYFVSAPLSCGERLVAGLRAGRGGQEHYLCCLRASDGALLWRTYVCGRHAAPVDLRAGRPPPAFEGPPAHSDGLVVTIAGSGVMASTDLATGGLRWLARYDQLTLRRQPARIRRNDVWQHATPLIAGGVVYATPRDADFLYAVDLASGRLLWRRERGDHRYLVAVRDGRAYLAGARAACLNVRGETEWEAELPSAVIGRPVLAAHVLHLPITGGVVFLDAATGGLLDRVAWPAWQHGQPRTYRADIASGDLHLAAGRLIVTTPFTINVFEPLRRREPLEDLLAARPRDPAVHAALGREHQWEGGLTKAVAAFEKALDLAGRDGGALSAAAAADVRRRLAACCEAASRRHERNRRLDLALAAARKALGYAAADAARSRLLLRAAELHGRLRQWRPALRAYQQALAGTQPSDGRWHAARAGIDHLLRRAGRAEYQDLERAAGDALRQGTTAALELVVRRYPNSLAAPAALLRLAAQAHGRPLDARRLLHRVASEYPDSRQAPEAIYRLALSYARDGAVAVARGALATLRRQHPRWRATVEGQAASAQASPDAFCAAHVPARAPAADRPPRLPLVAAWQVLPDYGPAELTVTGRPTGQADQFFVLSGTSVAAHAADSGRRHWADRPAWIGISILDADRPDGGVEVFTIYGGTPAARVGLRRTDVITRFDDLPIRNCAELIAHCTARRAGSRATIEILRGGRARTLELTLGARPTTGNDPQLRPAAYLASLGDVAVFRRPARVDAFHRRSGEPAWSVDLPEPDPQGLAHDGARTAVGAPGLVAAADTRGRIAGLEPATGRRLWTAALHEPQVHDLALTAHGLVVASSRPPTLQVLNPFDGRRQFRLVEPHAIRPPVFALDKASTLCYAIASTIGRVDLAARRVRWTTRIEDFTATRLWVAGANVLLLGRDRRGTEALECRRLDTGAGLWSLALARGETLRRGAVGRGAFYGVFRRAGRALLRRVNVATGTVQWTHELPRGESLGDWEPSAEALCLGLTVADAKGTRRAVVLALDKDTGKPRQRLEIGVGPVVQLRRIGAALYAVVETSPGELNPRERLFLMRGLADLESRVRVVRIDGAP